MHTVGSVAAVAAASTGILLVPALELVAQQADV